MAFFNKRLDGTAPPPQHDFDEELAEELYPAANPAVAQALADAERDFWATLKVRPPTKVLPFLRHPGRFRW